MRYRRLTLVLAGLILSQADPGRAQMRAKQAELKKVQQELEVTRRQIEDYQKQEQALEKDLAKIESRNAQTRRRMLGLQGLVKGAEARSAELREQLGALGRASGFWRSALQSDLRGFQSAWAGRDDSYGTAELWGESLRRAAIWEKARLLTGLEGLGRKTAMAEAVTSRQAQELQLSRQRIERQHQSRLREYRQKKAEMAQAQEKAAAARKRADELEESAKALTSLLRRYGRQKPQVDIPWNVARHSLIWPVEGAVLRPFGRERNAELDTWTIHQGVLIETRPEAPVAAIEAGRVIFAGNFRSYGQVIILDHGSHFYSVYGELKKPLKAKGERVRVGQIIGQSGRSENGRGRLYLEIRRGTEAMDPLAWLRKK
ncbi:MAG: peptidoglycan DD-metalloendopeptidase family protein [Elusimicrobia bacterium]|nr:peptidoglycan DD-metalloendopeptidase family protein [Elusimicrobiota bacterium]